MHNIQDDIPTAPLSTSPEDSAKLAALHDERTTSKHTPIIPPKPMRFKLYPKVSKADRLRILLRIPLFRKEAPKEPTPEEQVLEEVKRRKHLADAQAVLREMTPGAVPVVDIADLPTTILATPKALPRSVRPVRLETPKTDAPQLLTTPHRFVQYEYVEFAQGMSVVVMIMRALDAFRAQYQGFEPVQLDMDHMNRVCLDIFMRTQSGQMAMALAGIAIRDTSLMQEDYLQGHTNTIVVIGRWNTAMRRVTQKLAYDEQP